MNDEGFREIQLNGKQLVFLFMAATVVSVVIFLCGVLVGRGVRAGGGVDGDVASAEIAADGGVVTDNATPPPGRGAASEPHDGAAPAELSYADRLLRDTPPEETLKESPAAVQEPLAPEIAPAAPAARERTPEPPRAATKAPAAIATATDPSGPGFAVQIAAYRERRDADNLANQLIAKGYPAFVMDPVKGAPTALFRVRVGKYQTLKDAEAVSARLQSAEQFDTAWIAR